MGFDLIIFGGTGDLAWRKLMPALFQAFRHGSLPSPGRIIGVARDALSDDEYRNLIKKRFDELNANNSGWPGLADDFNRFAALLHYQRVDLSKPDDYAKLAVLVKQQAADVLVMYLATAPGLFTTVCEQIAGAGLNGPNTRVVLEKPLGSDLASNRAINDAVSKVLSENQIFRIDHYLGKPSVQNLLALRFGNAFFEPLWRRDNVANIQITLAESLGVDKRGGFYDGTGALRDMVQNHALQLLCAIAMEPPINAHADAIRDEKLKVLRSLKAWTPLSLTEHVVRGQYTAGNINGQVVPGYLQADGVTPQSQTETYVALRAEIANWRWAGVPFFIRTGKRLAASEAHIVINFRPTPHAIYPTPVGAANKLVINLQPRDGLQLHLLAQSLQQRTPAARGNPGLSPVQLDLDFDQRFGAERVGAYERLLLDVIDGRLNLFVRRDEQEAAWRWVEPVLDAWKTDTHGPRPYKAGSWGPSMGSAMVARDGAYWPEEA